MTEAEHESQHSVTQQIGPEEADMGRRAAGDRETLELVLQQQELEGQAHELGMTVGQRNAARRAEAPDAYQGCSHPHAARAY